MLISAFLKEHLFYINYCKKYTFYGFTINSSSFFMLLFICSAVLYTIIVNDHILPQVIITNTLTILFKI